MTMCLLRVAVAFALASTFSVAEAQILRYANKAQLIGAAITSPESTRLILSKTLDFCSSAAPSLKTRSEFVFAQWMERHRFYLRASEGYRTAAKQMSADPSVPPQGRMVLKKVFEVDFPRIISLQTEALIEPVRIAQEYGGAESMCEGYIAAVDAGKFDLKAIDPQLAEFYDQIAPR